MLTKIVMSSLWLGIVVLCVSPSSACAQVSLTNQHVDITLGFTPPTGTPGPGNLGVWNLGFSDETNGIEYATSGNPGATDWAQGVIRPNALTSRSTLPAFNFIGVPGGTPFYHIATVQQPNRLYVGTGAEGNDPGATNAPISYRLTDPRIDQPTAVDPDANLAPWLKLNLVSMSGPVGGQFSVWSGTATSLSQSNQGVDQVWMATSNGISSADSLYILNGSHIHFNYGFTEPGTYDLTFQASAFLSGTDTLPSNLSISDPTTFRFVVVPIPEPSWALAAVLIVFLRNRKTR